MHHVSWLWLITILFVLYYSYISPWDCIGHMIKSFYSLYIYISKIYGLLVGLQCQHSREHQDLIQILATVPAVLQDAMALEAANLRRRGCNIRGVPTTGGMSKKWPPSTLSVAIFIENTKRIMIENESSRTLIGRSTFFKKIFLGMAIVGTWWESMGFFLSWMGVSWGYN